MAQKVRTSPRARRGSGVFIEAAKLDTPENSLPVPISQLLATAWIGRRYRLAPHRARLVAQLCGLGGVQ